MDRNERANPDGLGWATIPRRLKWRWLVLAAVIPALEILSISIQFDTGIPQALGDWSGWWFGHSPEIAKFGLAAAGAFALISAPHYPALISSLADHSIHHRWWMWLAAHALSVGAFVFATYQVVETAFLAGAPSGAWVAVWSLLGLASVVFLALALAPPRFWRSLLRVQSKAFLVAFGAGASAWGLGVLAEQLWRPLAEATFALAARLLTLAGADLVDNAGEGVIGTHSFLVRIAPQCSGYDGIALVSVFLAIYLWMMRTELRLPHALLLFPVGILAIWLTNVLRITALILLGSHLSPEIAAQGFHSQAGWLAFTVVALALIALVHQLRFFSLREKPSHTDVAPHARLATALLVPILVLLMSKMVTAAMSAGFDLLYPLQVVATGAALWYFRKAYSRLGWGLSWQAVVVGVAVFVLWALLETPKPNVQSGRGLPDGLPLGIAVGWVVFRVIGGVITVPLAEELAFRGYLIRKLVSAEFEKVPGGTFTWASFLVTSGLFGLLHQSWIAGSIAGMGYAVALYRRGRMGDAVVAHATTNLLLAGYVVLFDQWEFWE